MITDFNKLEHIQRKFAALCHIRFFQDLEYHYERLNLLTLHISHRHFDAFFLMNVFFFRIKFCPLSSK
jgi:hypothetical protein